MLLRPRCAGGDRPEPTSRPPEKRRDYPGDAGSIASSAPMWARTAGITVTTRTFAAIVQRTERWDASRPAEQQDGFAGHARFVAELEATGFIALAGLLHDTSEVLFIFHAEDADEVRQRMSRDPWQKDGHTRLTRVEEIHIRIGAPVPRTAG